MRSINTPTTKRALLISFFVNISDVVTNISVAIITGSAVMAAEAAEGLADLTAVGLLLVGHRRSQRKADRSHQFGYGKELYFWALLAAIVMLFITATLSFYFGFQKILHPEPVEWAFLAYGVLILAVITNSYAVWTDIRVLLSGKRLSALPKILRESSLLAPKMAFVLDGMGMLAALLGLGNLIVYGITGNARFDGVGAMFVGIILAVSAIILLIGLRGLITGQSVPRPLADDIRKAATTIPGVLGVLDLRTMVLGANSTLVNLEVHLQDNLTTDEVEAIMDKVKDKVGRAVPGYTHVQVEPETPAKKRQR